MPVSHFSRLIPALLLGVAACGGADAASRVEIVGLDGPATAVTSAVDAHPAERVCGGAFVAHDLGHLTSGPGDTASTFDGTGAGLALGDLDDDGDLDVVAANLSGSSSLLRNDGTGRFTAEELIVGRFRHVAVLDVDGDGDRDIALSTGVGVPVLLEAVDGPEGVPVYERRPLEGVRAATYSMGWSDLEGDGDLDLVTGSYNAELSEVRNTPVLGSDTGVVVHLADGSGAYVATRIAAEAQALAIRLVDVDADGRIDVVVGNDLATPDGIWLDNRGGWLEVDRLTTSSFSTMSLDAGDVDNDGDLDLFSTDMKPMSDDPETRDRYREVDADMAAMPVPDEIQRPENVLNIADGDDFANTADQVGLDATGWSWSGLFGDLDGDGLLDVHVVNGMRSDVLFSFLPEARLVEPNQVFRNTGDGFETMPAWGLDDPAGGRGSALGDLDGDGDLDVIVNNLDEPTRWYENQLCGGDDLLVDLAWPASANTEAVGALVIVERGDERYIRTIDLTRGYLSGGPTTAHVGLGDDGGAVTVTVRWPDGQVSTVADVPASGRLTVTRSTPVGG